MNAQETCGVEMRHVHKSFGGVRALNDVSLRVRRGEIHALVGENGAGKSTLMNVLAGVVHPDAGSIALDGRIVEVASPHTARALGIGIIHQELALVPALSVAENIFLHRLGGRGGFVPWRKLFAQAEEVTGGLGFHIDPRIPVERLSVAYQQVVEIARALSERVRVLILDEPTAMLAPSEAEQLFSVLTRLRAGGTSIIYISHRLEEIFRICDAITVLRDGEITGNVKPSEVSHDDLIQLMIGRRLTTLFPKRAATHGDVALQVKGLRAGARVRDVSFRVRRGEVLGVAGLVGSGRTETARALFGADKKTAGRVWVDGREIDIRNPHAATRAGIGLVPEDRKDQGVVLSISIQHNISMASLRQVTAAGIWLRLRQDRRKAETLAAQLGIKTPNVSVDVAALSGGNQQKVVLAKWLAHRCKVLLLDEPTRGVDVGAKAEIYGVINTLAEQGLAVIMISSELLELIGMCDRVMVLKDGRVTGFVNKPDLSEASLMRLAVGQHAPLPHEDTFGSKAA